MVIYLILILKKLINQPFNKKVLYFFEYN